MYIYVLFSFQIIVYFLFLHMILWNEESLNTSVSSFAMQGVFLLWDLTSIDFIFIEALKVIMPSII